MKETVLLIDGDTIAYRSAAIVEKREIEVKHIPTGKTKIFKTRTEFKEKMQLREQPYDLNDYEIKDIQTPEDVANALHIVKSLISKLYNAVEPDRMEIYIGGVDNFREKLPLPRKYKGNRSTMLRPVHLTAVKDYVIKKYGAKTPVGIEADDAVNIRAYEELAKGNIAIIGSNDKDTLQSEGVTFFDYTKDNPKLFLIPEIGEIHLEKTQCKGSGLKFFAYQLLCGDITDNYKPSEVSGKKFGATSAFKLLNPLETKPEILDAVVQQYKKWYPDIVTYTSWDGKEITTNWQGMLDLYFSCAYMQRSRKDKTTWVEFFKERGWDGT